MKTKRIAILVILALIFVISVDTVLAENFIMVKDSEGYEVKINLPVQKIVCLSSSLNELLVALGAGDKIIGRDDWSDIPASLRELKDVPMVASSSYRPQIEAIIEMNPDLIVADTMLQDDARKKFNSFGIPVIAERTSEASNLFNVISRLSKIVENEESGTKIIQFISKYRDLIKERVVGIDESEKTRLYWEWRGPYKTGSAKSTIQPRIELIGGINICADTEGRYPEVSREFIIEQDPELIIRMESRGSTREAMKESWKEVMTRTGLKQTSAVRNSRVHVVSWSINTGLPSIIGDLYYAKLAHPVLFVDIEPYQIYEDLMKQFFGIKPNDVIVFPEY